MVQEVHLAKSPPEMEADLRKCGEDIKRGLRQCVDRTYRSPRQQIQCGGGWHVDKSTTQKPCSPSPHRRPWYSIASCGAASCFCCVRRACSSGRHGGEACGGRFGPPSKTRSCGCSVELFCKYLLVCRRPLDLRTGEGFERLAQIAFLSFKRTSAIGGEPQNSTLICRKGGVISAASDQKQRTRPEARETSHENGSIVIHRWGPAVIPKNTCLNARSGCRSAR